MNIITDLTHWQAHRKTLSASIGFVPTMGNLHRGHLSLITRSQAENQQTIVSIFVNPHQFNEKEDFEAYPQTLDADLLLLENLGVDYCLIPSREALYADGFRYQISQQDAALEGEGKARPGHFTGMLTVIMKFIQLVQPSNIYFGEKDYQQYLLVRGMAAAFFMDVKVNACATIREASGLPMSSRNNRLSKAQRAIADRCAAIFHQPNITCEAIKAALAKEPIQLEYLEEAHQRRFIAVRIDDIRLIDNYLL